MHIVNSDFSHSNCLPSFLFPTKLPLPGYFLSDIYVFSFCLCPSGLGHLCNFGIGIIQWSLVSTPWSHNGRQWLSVAHNSAVRSTEPWKPLPSTWLTAENCLVQAQSRWSQLLGVRTTLWVLCLEDGTLLPSHYLFASYVMFFSSPLLPRSSSLARIRINGMLRAKPYFCSQHLGQPQSLCIHCHSLHIKASLIRLGSINRHFEGTLTLCLFS